MAKANQLSATTSVSPAAVKSPMAGAKSLAKFLKEAADAKGGLSLAQRRVIVEQALLLIEMTYAHLPLKRAIHAIEPIQRLKLLQFRLSEMKPAQMPSELQFHEEMQDIFTSLRDYHTNYSLPAPFADQVAVLPFLIEEYFEGKGSERKFLLTHVDEGFEHPTFVVGVEILFWNGVPIERAVEINGETQAGSNLEARFAEGLFALTARAMVGSLPPDEFWVTITYRSLAGEILEHKQEWQIIASDSEDGGDGIAAGLKKSARIGVDLQRALINRVRKMLYAPKAMAAERARRRSKAKGAPAGSGLDTTMPMKVEIVDTPHGKRGYMRIFDFEEENNNAFIAEFIRLMELLPQDGLIIDVRSNGGGYIANGERLLQLFTPREIEPETFEFLSTPINLKVCRVAPEDEELAPWVESISQSVITGATFSRGFNLTAREFCNDLGQRYYGPVVLITDALTFSTTDMFIAGFQDHEIGDILGVHGNIGAGGANVWDHDFLVKVMKQQADTPFRRLPKQTGMRVAIRRSVRVGKRTGTLLEELGVIPDAIHLMTKRDLLEGNIDLINHASEMLAKKPVRKLTVDISTNAGQATILAKVDKIDRLDLYINGRPLASGDVVGGEAKFDNLTLTKGATLLLKGFDRKNELVANYKRVISS